jgi:hypothetical protein
MRTALLLFAFGTLGAEWAESSEVLSAGERLFCIGGTHGTRSEIGHSCVGSALPLTESKHDNYPRRASCA